MRASRGRVERPVSEREVSGGPVGTMGVGDVSAGERGFAGGAVGAACEAGGGEAMVVDRTEL